MLREKTEPGLVAFYNIRPRTGTGLFLQPRGAGGRPHNVPLLLFPSFFSQAFSAAPPRRSQPNAQARKHGHTYTLLSGSTLQSLYISRQLTASALNSAAHWSPMWLSHDAINSPGDSSV